VSHPNSTTTSPFYAARTIDATYSEYDCSLLTGRRN